MGGTKVAHSRIQQRSAAIVIALTFHFDPLFFTLNFTEHSNYFVEPVFCPDFAATTPTTTTIPATTVSCQANAFLDNEPVIAGIVVADSKLPRVALAFTSRFDGCLKGVRYYSVNANDSVVIEAFNSSKYLLERSNSFSSNINGGFASAYFSSCIPITSNTAYSVSFTALNRRQAAQVFATSKSIGDLTFINSWYQYPPFTNPAVPRNYSMYFFSILIKITDRVMKTIRITLLSRYFVPTIRKQQRQPQLQQQRRQQ